MLSTGKAQIYEVVWRVLFISVRHRPRSRISSMLAMRRVPDDERNRGLEMNLPAANSRSFLTTARLAVEGTQLVFCRFQTRALILRKFFPGAVDVKIKHRHGRTERVCFSSFAPIGGTLKRARDTTRIAACKHSSVQIESIARLGHALRPAFRLVCGHGVEKVRLT